MRERRLAKVAVTSELFIELFTQDNTITAMKATKGVPKDAAYIGSLFDDRRMEAYMIFEHESFEPVAIGSEIPTLRIEFTNYYGLAAVRLLLESSKE